MDIINTAEILNYKIMQGDTFTLTLEFVDENNQPIDISLYKSFFTLKKNINDLDTDAIIKQDYTNFVNPLKGRALVINLGNTDTKNLQGQYYWSLRYKTGTGEIKTPFAGSFIVEKHATLRAS